MTPCRQASTELSALLVRSAVSELAGPLVNCPGGVAQCALAAVVADHQVEALVSDQVHGDEGGHVVAAAAVAAVCGRGEVVGAVAWRHSPRRGAPSEAGAGVLVYRPGGVAQAPVAAVVGDDQVRASIAGDVHGRVAGDVVSAAAVAAVARGGEVVGAVARGQGPARGVLREAGAGVLVLSLIHI